MGGCPKHPWTPGTADDTSRASGSSTHKGLEVTKGSCVSGPQREPGGDDRQQVAARWGRAPRTTIEEPGVQAKRGKAFKRLGWFSFQEHLAATWRESCRRQEETVRAAGDQERGVACEIRPGRKSQRDEALEGLVQPQRATSSLWPGTHPPVWSQRSEKGTHV